MSTIKYDRLDEPIVLSKALLDTFLEHPKGSDLLALYTFYYYTAKWQKTNQVRATTAYTIKALNWSEDRVRRAKKILIEKELIKDIRKIDEKGRVEGYFIKVNFVWRKNQPPEKPATGECQSLANQEGNSLSSNSRNALSSNNEMLPLLRRGVRGELRDKFEEFWQRYPLKRRGSKGEALKSWKKVCRLPVKERPTWTQIRRALHDQKESERWQQSEFIPLASTWLNNSRWLDDPEELLSYGPHQKGASNPKTLASPSEITKQHFGEYYKSKLKNLIQPAIDLMTNPTPQEESEMAQTVCDLYKWYAKHSYKPNRETDPYTEIPLTNELVEWYIDWLSKQGHWISDISARHFSPESGVFKRFLIEIQHRERRDFLTGRAITR
jgi:hypothetical protein